MKLKATGNGEGRTCLICGKQFWPKTIESYYCSRKCQQAAYRKKKREEAAKQKLQKQIDAIPEGRTYISVHEALLIYDVNRTTLYRWIRSGRVKSIRTGSHSIRLKIEELDKLLPHRLEVDRSKLFTNNIFDMTPAHCYTIGEICKKFDLDDSTVWAHIRKYSIPTRQVGNYVYAPKSEIDKLYKSL